MLAVFVVVFLTLPWIPAAQGSVVKHDEDGSLNTSVLWNYIRHYEQHDDHVDERPPLVHDVAWLTLNVSTGFDLQVWAQSQQCWKCPVVYVTEVTSRNTTTILVNTTFPTDIKFARQHPGGFAEDICSLTVTFREHGNYWMFMDYSTALGHSPCFFLLTNDPSQAEMPILFVGLGLLGLAAFASMIFRLYSCLQNSRLVRKSADITDPNQVPDTNNAFDMDKDTPADLENGGHVTTAQSVAAPEEKKKPRLKSLDTFRGLNLVVMIFVNYGGGGYWIFEHPPWNGLTVADLVFPWFVFIMGTSMTFSFRGMYRRQMTSRAIVVKIVTRSAKLFALGIVLNSSWGPVDLNALRIPGVLQRFALTYLVTALLKLAFYRHKDSHQDRKWAVVRDVVLYLPEWFIHLALLALFLALTYALPVPGCPTGYTGPGGLSEGGAYMNCTGGAARYIDVTVLGERHLYQFPTPQVTYQTPVAYDPEGILGTLTSIFICFLGVQSGNILSIYQEHRSRVVRWLIWAVILFSANVARMTVGFLSTKICALAVASAMAKQSKRSCRKQLCPYDVCEIHDVDRSVSFILTTASFAFVVLSIFYLVIDVWGWWGGQPFIFPGMNSIVVYFCHEIFWRVLPINWQVEEVHWKLLLQDVWGTAFWIIIAYILYRKKIFVAL